MHSEQSAQGAPQPKSHSRRVACAGPALSLLLLLPLLLLQSCLTLSPRGLKPARPLCPRNSPGQNTGVGSLSLLQRISPTQGSKPRLHCRRVLYHLSPPRKPVLFLRPRSRQPTARLPDKDAEDKGVFCCCKLTGFLSGRSWSFGFPGADIPDPFVTGSPFLTANPPTAAWPRCSQADSEPHVKAAEARVPASIARQLPPDCQ